MTKTLTEQWREGTLPEGYYYISFDETDNNPIIYHCTEYRMNNCRWHNEEVIAPVPRYDEYQDIIQQNVNQESAIETYIEDIKRLQERLAIATKALNGIRDVWVNNPNKFSYIARIANRKAKTALEEMEGVK